MDIRERTLFDGGQMDIIPSHELPDFATELSWSSFGLHSQDE
jgi:hypothetical protein